MRISIPKKTPSTREIMEVLSQEFSDYSFKRFGLGTEKSIIVRKSIFVGVQISRNDDYITVEGAHPTIISWLFSILLFDDFTPMYGSERRKLAEEIGTFLKCQYG